MGVIPSCLGIIVGLFTFFTAASPIVAAGYPDAFLRTSAVPEILQSEPAVQGIAIQKNIGHKVNPIQSGLNVKSLPARAGQNSGNNQKNNAQPATKSAGGGNSTIMTAINSYRQSKGLSPANTDHNTCAFARTRAAEIAGSFSHDGFTQRIQNKTLPYPTYSSVTENIAQTKDPNKVVSLWINSPGHEKNLTADTPYICVESSGSYYAMEGWKP